MHSSNRYAPFTVKMALQIAAPHTWPASILPVLFASSIACVIAPPLSVSTSLVCLLIAILMQSAVNTFNDYYDYVKGTDSDEDNVDPSDAVLVYNNVNPQSALKLAVGFLVSAFLLGIYIIVRSGLIPLVIALIGAFFVVFYSAGKTPISYLPLGEIISGFVMGGLITLATYYALTLALDWMILVWAIPLIIGIGLIMLTNNTCDIERDLPANRRTLAVVLGRSRARLLYRILVATMIAFPVIAVGIRFTSGLVAIPFMLLACYPSALALFKNPLNQNARRTAMSQILSLYTIVTVFYVAAILVSGYTLTL